jgi:hypothetical protein
MNKQHILDEIKRTAKDNGGVPLGQDRFSQETGIRNADWFGIFWARWGDAVQEAGLSPNKLREAYEEVVLIGKYVDLIRELGRIPVKGELRLKRRNDPTFPNDKTFERFGSKTSLVTKALEYCHSHNGLDDVARLCAGVAPNDVAEPIPAHRPKAHEDGSVYLRKAGRHYKIGRSNAVGRREYEMSIQLPQKARTVHVILTDDPVGIEAYWHKRFSSKNTNGEWFDLDTSDVQAFRRRKFM